VSCLVIATDPNATLDQRALAVGPDGNVWIAGTTGLVQVNTATNAVSTYTGGSYQEVVASGDGRLYLLGTGGTSLREFP